MLKVVIVRVIALSLLLGGGIRLFANRSLFETFGIGAIWMEAPYSIYIYRVLAGFVLVPGIVLMIMAKDPARYSFTLKGMAGGFAIVGVVMILAGLTVGLPARYYLPDPLYCFVVAVLLWRSGS